MTMNRRRSLFVTGCLMAALVLFGSMEAYAQEDETAATQVPPAPSAVAIPTDDVEFDRIKVTWAAPTVNDDQGPLTAYRVYYSTRDFDNAQNAMGSMTVDDEKMEATLSGLMPDDMYYVHVASVNDFGIGALDNTGASDTTDEAPEPERVTDVMAMAGDEMITATWDEPYAGHARAMVDAYMVQYRTSRSRSEDAGDWMDVDEDDIDADMREVMIMDLDNGMSYDVQVKAMNDAGGTSAAWSRQTEDSGATPMADGDGDMPTPTPALPVFGAFALGAGLLAAGRARLQRRREQRKLTR